MTIKLKQIIGNNIQYFILMKLFKKVVIGLESLCLMGIVIYAIEFHYPEKKGVEHILSVTKIDIPKYEIISKEEVWSDYYDYKISFPIEYSTSILNQFEEKVKRFQNSEYDDDGKILIYTCKCDENSCSYYCTTNDPGDYHYWVDIELQEGTASIRMNFEFGEQLICMISIHLIAFLGLFIGAIYAIVIIVVKIKRKINNR